MSLSKKEKMADENCHRLREFIRSEVQGRRSTLNQGLIDVEKCTDVLTLLLQSPDVFTDEVIVDELIDMMLAGVNPSSMLT